MANRVFEIDEKVLRLWADARKCAGGSVKEKAYFSTPWHNLPSADHEILAVLCWGPHRDERQESLWRSVRAAFEELDRPLHKLKPPEAERLARLYGLPWQRAWLQNLAAYLRTEGLSMTELSSELRSAGPGAARAILQDIVRTKTAATKIIDCYLADYLQLDAFPIDIWVSRVLKSYGVPADSWAVAEIAHRNDIPVRLFGKLVYSHASELGA